jgi:hypothetical protein
MFMIKRGGKSIPGIVASRILGLLIFLLLLYVASELSFVKNSSFNSQIVELLFQNIWLIALITVIFMFGDVFNALIFPLNLPGPIFNAVGSLFLLTLLFRILLFIDFLLGLGVFRLLDSFSFLIFPIVFVVVLVAGYFRIFIDLVGPGKTRVDRTARSGVKLDSDEKKGRLEWGDVGEEFKMAVYDVISLVRESINEGRKKK